MSNSGKWLKKWWLSPSKDVKAILHLSFWKRLGHKNSQRIIVGISAGCVIMFVGTLIGVNSEPIGNCMKCPHTIIDTIGFFIHGVGAVPLMRYLDPLWDLVVAEVAE